MIKDATSKIKPMLHSSTYSSKDLLGTMNPEIPISVAPPKNGKKFKKAMDAPMISIGYKFLICENITREHPTDIPKEKFIIPWTMKLSNDLKQVMNNITPQIIVERKEHMINIFFVDLRTRSVNMPDNMQEMAIPMEQIDSNIPASVEEYP